MKQTFEQKLARVAGRVRQVEFDNPQRRYGDALLYWFNKAEQLHDAAMILGGDPSGRNFEAFALLAGFSLELLVKGTLIGLDDKAPPTHDLVALSDKVGFEISSDDRAVLEAFTIYTKWYSRYPVAKNAQSTIDGMKFLNAQYVSSGKLQDIVEAARLSPRAVNTLNYERLYGFFVDRFIDVKSSVYESASFSFDPSAH